MARSAEVTPRQIVQAQLLGREIALWRDATNAVNAWENRCPHRGVRLSIGINAGTELRCRYHGWRFAAGGGQCTLIPAHPTQKPAAAVRANVYGGLEYGGFVWVCLEPASGDVSLPVSLPNLPSRGTTLRSIHVDAPAAAVSRALQQPQGAVPGGAFVTALDDFTLLAHPGATPSDAAVTFLLQPMTNARTVVHGVVHAEYPGDERLAVYRAHNARLNALRDALA